MMLRQKNDHVCLRCGLCCQGRGDFAFNLDDIESEYEPDDCTALVFEGGLAVCRMQYDKRDCCKDYPFLWPNSTNPQDFMCERELKEARLWMEYIAS